jgi:3'-phosphoadenosine 5'-phosphosulfate sulfotransferase (PAPS reductase)/FAD synthetase
VPCRFDKICKVEPFQRALAETKCDIMINGRRRDHGAERAHLHLFDIGRNGVGNCQVQSLREPSTLEYTSLTLCRCTYTQPAHGHIRIVDSDNGSPLGCLTPCPLQNLFDGNP